MFIFNHRNNIDPIIVGSLIKDNWTGVGKKELESDPIVGAIGKLTDTIFIDREDQKKAVESLKEAEELARKGLSVMISPEGTRIDTRSVGPFKKGPFRLAMAAGVPIVPVVIRNAETISARDSQTLHPGTVDIVVYPPLSLEDWNVDNLPDRIAEVRQLFVDTLKSWPVGKVPDAALYKKTAKKAPAKKAPAKKAAVKKTTKTAAKKASAKKAEPSTPQPKVKGRR